MILRETESDQNMTALLIGMRPALAVAGLITMNNEKPAGYVNMPMTGEKVRDDTNRLRLESEELGKQMRRDCDSITRRNDKAERRVTCEIESCICKMDLLRIRLVAK